MVRGTLHTYPLKSSEPAAYSTSWSSAGPPNVPCYNRERPNDYGTGEKTFPSVSDRMYCASPHTRISTVYIPSSCKSLNTSVLMAAQEFH